jgi:hypothetical protein
MAAIACASRNLGQSALGQDILSLTSRFPKDSRELLAEMHNTITTAIVAITVRIVFAFAFVFMCAVAFGFAFSFAAGQCSCMLRCLDFWAASRGGRSGDRTISGRSRMLFYFQLCPWHATAVQKLYLDCTEGCQRLTKFDSRSLPFISGKATATAVLISLLFFSCSG